MNGDGNTGVVGYKCTEENCGNVQQEEPTYVSSYGAFMCPDCGESTEGAPGTICPTEDCGTELGENDYIASPNKTFRFESCGHLCSFDSNGGFGVEFFYTDGSCPECESGHIYSIYY